MKTAHKKFMSVLVVMFAMILLFSAVMSGRVTLPAFAAETGYTGALEDLQKDENFNVEEYPDKADDYSIQVIQIAESTAGELFVYTYQPSQKTQYLEATEINMSLTDKMGKEFAEDEECSPADRPQLYGLTLLNSNGVFCKYKVNDFVVGSNTVRFYNIASIYREWLKGIDAETGNDTTKNSVAFFVGKLYTAITKDGEISYICENRKVVRILDPFWGFQRYTDGFFLKTTGCDGHYVAFSTDWQIDELYEADVTYQSRGVHRYYNLWEGSGTRYDEWKAQYAFLTDDQEFIKERTGWLWGSEAKYNRIQSIKKFIESEDLTDETKANLNGKQWVLRFAETDYNYNYDSRCGDWSEVSNVAVLRLKFKSEGVVYNLGTVSDKGTESPNPTNPPSWVTDKVGFFRYVWNCIVKLFQGKANFIEGFVAVIALLVVLVLLPVGIFVLSIIFPPFGAVVKLILKSIGKALLWLLKGVWWLMQRFAVLIWLMISAPFRMIARAVKRRREEKYNAPDPKPDKTGRIYKTTDGYLSGRSDIKKPRNIAAIEQRKDDGALAVVKVYSRKGKEQKLKEGKNYIPKLVLKPKKHATLKKDSIVGRQVIVGVKQGNGKPPKSIFPGDLEKTQDKLTKKELKKIQAEVHNDTRKHRKTYKKKMKAWNKHFKNKKERK